MTDQTFITHRQNDITDAFNSHSAEKLMAFYTKDNLDFTDHGAAMLHLDFPALHTFYTAMYKSCRDIRITTHNLSGTKDFTAWEWNITFKYESELEGVDEKLLASEGLTVGNNIKMVGTSLAWWENGKIKKGADYGKVVESFEGR